MAGFTDFAKKLAGTWNLPPIADKTAHSACAIQHVHLPSRMDEPPALLPNPKEKYWEMYGRRLWVQVDNQQVANIFAGVSHLTAMDLEPLCIRVSRKIFSLLELGWLPRTDTSPFVEWDRREYNSLADHAANVALDAGEDWSSPQSNADVKQALLQDNAHIRICSDGAKRGSGSSAAGYAIMAYSPDGTMRVLKRSGCSLGKLGSAFPAEMLALEWCLDVFLDSVV